MTCSTVTPSLPSKKVTTAIDVAAHRFPPRELAAQGEPNAFLADSSRPAEKSSGPARAPIQVASFRLLQSFKPGARCRLIGASWTRRSRNCCGAQSSRIVPFQLQRLAGETIEQRCHLLRCMSLFMARNGLAAAVAACPLLRDQRTWLGRGSKSENDPGCVKTPSLNLRVENLSQFL